MKQYFKVTYQHSESVYSSNIAHAETAADVTAHYNRYEWVDVQPAESWEVDAAARRGMPIVEIDPQPVEDAAEEQEEQEMTVYEKMIEELNARTDRSAWNKGVTVYAVELVEELEERAAYEGRNPEAGKECREWMLNGATDWAGYSWGGSSLIYNEDIAERLCTPSELKKTRNGERRPNSREEWLDVQARALYQACNRVARLYRSIVTA